MDSRNDNRKKILFVSPIPLGAVRAGNQARNAGLLRFFAEAGFMVHYVYVDTRKDFVTQTRQYIEEQGFQFHFYHAKAPLYRCKSYLNNLFSKINSKLRLINKIDDFYDHALGRFARKLVRENEFDVVFVSYVWLSKTLTDCVDNKDMPGKRPALLLDTHDIFADRHLLFRKYGMEYSWFSTTKKQERIGLERADTVIAIQDQDGDYFKNNGAADVVTVGHILKPEKLPLSAHENVILFVGSNIPPNAYGLESFRQQVLPFLKQSMPDIRIRVAGTICESEVAKDIKAFTLLGRVEDLKACYQEAGVVFSPVTFGTGLKIKCVEALAYGRPVVTYSHGSVGLEEAVGRGVEVADSPESFAHKTVELLRDKKRLEMMSTSAYECVLSECRRNEQQLLELLDR